MCMRQVAALVQAALPKAPLVVLSAMDKTTDDLFAAAKSAARGELDAACRRSRASRAHHRAEAAALVTRRGGRRARARARGRVRRDRAAPSQRRASCARSAPRRWTRSPPSASASRRASSRRSSWREGVRAELVDARLVMRTDARSGSAAAADGRRPVARGAAPRAAAQARRRRRDAGLHRLDRGRPHDDARPRRQRLHRGDLRGGAPRQRSARSGPTSRACSPPIRGSSRRRCPIPELSFAEAAELAAFGAKVLHPATIQPAIEGKVPVTVRHTRRPEGRFTTITGNVRSGRPVTALATRGPVTVLTVTSTRMLAQSGFLARLFEVFGRLRVSVDLVATAEVSVSMTVDADAPLPGCSCASCRRSRPSRPPRERAIVAIVGERLKHTPGLGARVFAALGDINVEMISMGANEINLSLVVQHQQRTDALRRLHRALIEAPAPANAGVVRP